MTDDFRIVICDLPDGLNGCIVKVDDYCTILINAKLTFEQQQITAQHEILHYRLGHMDDHDTPVREKENEIKKHLPVGAGRCRWSVKSE